MELGLLAHTFSLTIQEAEAGGSLRTQGQPELFYIVSFKPSGATVRSCEKRKEEKEKI